MSTVFYFNQLHSVSLHKTIHLQQPVCA